MMSEGNSIPQASRLSPSMSPKRIGGQNGENTDITDDLTTTDKNGSPSEFGRGVTIASKSLKASMG